MIIIHRHNSHKQKLLWVFRNLWTIKESWACSGGLPSLNLRRDGLFPLWHRPVGSIEAGAAQLPLSTRALTSPPGWLAPAAQPGGRSTLGAPTLRLSWGSQAGWYGQQRAVLTVPTALDNGSGWWVCQPSPHGH